MNAQSGQHLVRACRDRNFDLVRSLVSSGEASVNYQTGDRQTPTKVCCFGEYTDILTYLIESGANLEMTTNGGSTVLHYAALFKKHLSMAVLLRHGANAEVAASDGTTALMFSAVVNSPDCATLLLQHGVAVDAVNKSGRTALYWASYKGHLPIVELLVEGGSDIEIVDGKGEKARDVAREKNHTAIVEYLRTPLKDKRWQRRSGLAMVRSSIRDVEDPDRAAVIRALQCDDMAREIGSFL
jgi:ankyrin repeat protein